MITILGTSTTGAAAEPPCRPGRPAGGAFPGSHHHAGRRGQLRLARDPRRATRRRNRRHPSRHAPRYHPDQGGHAGKPLARRGSVPSPPLPAPDTPTARGTCRRSAPGAKPDEPRRACNPDRPHRRAPAQIALPIADGITGVSLAVAPARTIAVLASPRARPHVAHSARPASPSSRSPSAASCCSTPIAPTG